MQESILFGAATRLLDKWFRSDHHRVGPELRGLQVFDRSSIDCYGNLRILAVKHGVPLGKMLPPRTVRIWPGDTLQVRLDICDISTRHRYLVSTHQTENVATGVWVSLLRVQAIVELRILHGFIGAYVEPIVCVC